MKNKKGAINETNWMIGGVVILILIIVGGYVITTYNSLVTGALWVDGAWGNVETVYQRRADLIPNLVATIEGARDFERDTLVQITNARSAWTNAKTPEQKVEAANAIESSIGRLIVVSENYPDLKVNQNFLALQDELANTENKVAVERIRYNDAVRSYNTKIKVFPSNLIAGMFNFEPRTFFEAQAGAENAPKVDFN